MRPSGPLKMLGMPRSGLSAGRGGVPPTLAAFGAAQGEIVLPVIFGVSYALPGATCRRKQLLVDVMKMTPDAGSAAGGPVMFTPPAPPGQFCVGRAPSGLPRWFGGAKNGASASVRRASASASFRISGV